MKYYLFAVLFLSLFTCERNPNGPVIDLGEDYEIYSIVLKENLADARTTIILSDFTRGEDIGEHHLESLQDSIPEFKTETLTDYRTKNLTRTPLQPVPDVTNLVMQRDIDEKPEQSVSVSLSLVGYDKTKTQALVTRSDVWAPLAGSGWMFLLEKERGEWKIRYVRKIWIS